MKQQQPIAEQYYNLMKLYVAEPTEERLVAVAELGHDLLASGTPLEESAEVHAQALERWARESVDQTMIHAARATSELLMELLMAYGLFLRQHLEQQAEAERYRLAARGANDGLWDWNLTSDKVYFSPRWKSMLGYDEREIGNSPEEWFRRVHPEDPGPLKAAIASHLEGQTASFEHEHRMVHKNGQTRWMLSRGIVVRNAYEKAVRMTGSQTDITKRRAAEEASLSAAFHDALTGLPNRTLFMDRLALAVKRGKRRGASLAGLIFLDLDRFKVINDSLGHLIGDQLLIEVARRLETCLRPGDTVARLGGDEFTILLEKLEDIYGATLVAKRIHEALSSPFQFAGHEVFTNASIGITLISPSYDQPENVLRDADTAMYQAKAMGKGRHVVFDNDMHDRAMARLEMENNLRRAIDRQELLIHYQPIVSLKTGRLIGFEALLRWMHSNCELISSPAEFIPVAEETGLIVPIGRWVLREACRQMSAWQAEISDPLQLSISVNLSRKQLAQPNLIDEINETLAGTALDARCLKLEITESMVMENAESAIDTLSQLRDLSVQSHMDDFGTGYSSLSTLHRFPIDVLKIDRSFIAGMGVNGKNSAVARTIVALAHNLGMEVIAEGVETAQQMEQLRELNCEYGQGYFFSKPLDGPEVDRLLAACAQCDRDKLSVQGSERLPYNPALQSRMWPAEFGPGQTPGPACSFNSEQCPPPSVTNSNKKR